MRLSRSFLRHGLLGLVFAGSLGFGASQAFARPRTAGATDGTCVWGDPGARWICQSWCQENYYVDGACTRKGFCACTGYIGP